MHTLTNSEDRDEMLHKAAFHLVLHYLLRQKQSSEEVKQFLFENYLFCDSKEEGKDQ